MGLLDDRVVIVTGGAGGIGRACAIRAAQDGASVLVNDIGADVSGRDASSSEAAEAVAAEIRTAGGRAVAHGGSVASYSDVEDMVRDAAREFGGVHAVINPAGILRDRMLHKMDPADWDAVIEVHLRGAFNLTRATVELFREQQDGAYVHFTSTSGLIGNLAQANYAAAKMGVVGLSRILAMEGALKNVRSNVIAPFAWTRMIATIPVKDEASAQRVDRMRTAMRPEQVAVLSSALASPAAAHVSGQIFAVRGNELCLFSQPRPIRSMAALSAWTPESIIDVAFPAMTTDFTPLEPSAAVFPYDPL